jgi:hypothetical protein
MPQPLEPVFLLPVSQARMESESPVAETPACFLNVGPARSRARADELGQRAVESGVQAQPRAQPTLFL